MVDKTGTACCNHLVKTKSLIALYGSVNAVRELWTPPLSRSAIYQWGEEVPELREFQLREMIPGIDKRLDDFHPKKKDRRNGVSRAA